MDQQQHPLGKLEFLDNEGKVFKPIYEKLIESMKLPDESVNTKEVNEQVSQ